MGRYDASARSVIAGRRKYVPKERVFLGIDTNGRIVSFEECERLLRKIDAFGADLKADSRYALHFYDGSVCQEKDINGAIDLLKRQLGNIQSLDVFYAFASQGRYVVKNTTVAEMSVVVTDDTFRVSIQTEREAMDFSPLLKSLKQSIHHLPKTNDSIIKERKKVVAVMAMGVGLIFALLVSALPMLDARGRDFYRDAVFLYILINLLLSAFIGGGLVAMFIIPMYNAFFIERFVDEDGVVAYRRKTPEQFAESSEVWIGDKKDFGRNRAALKWLYEKSKLLLVVGLIILLLVPIVIIWRF